MLILSSLSLTAVNFSRLQSAFNACKRFCLNVAQIWVDLRTLKLNIGGARCLISTYTGYVNFTFLLWCNIICLKDFESILQCCLKRSQTKTARFEDYWSDFLNDTSTSDSRYDSASAAANMRELKDQSWQKNRGFGIHRIKLPTARVKKLTGIWKLLNKNSKKWLKYDLDCLWH